MTAHADDALTASIAMIGYGAMAEMHAVAFRTLGAQIHIVAGPKRADAESFAARHGASRVTTNTDDAIAEPNVDAIVVASPSSLHFTQARAGLKAGRHVLVEIPLALSYVEAEALVHDASAAQRVLMVCHTLRYSETLVAARSVIAERNLHPLHVVARSLALRHENVGWTGRRRSWTDNLLWHHGGHVVDAALLLLGSPVTTISAAVGPVWAGSGLPMDYGITIRTEAGRIATISLSYNARVATSDYVVVGAGDTIVMTDAAVRSTNGLIFEAADPAVLHERAVLAQDRDFLNSIATGNQPDADARSVMPAMRVLQSVWDRVR